MITALRRRVIRLPAQTLHAPCLACGKEVETLTRSQASELLHAGDNELNEFIAAGQVHTIETVNGHLWVCKDSLFLSRT